MSHTGIARLRLALTPITVLIFLVFLIGLSLARAVYAFACGWADVVDAARHWYRYTWRVARYGSVWDDVDEEGYPNAWKR